MVLFDLWRRDSNDPCVILSVTMQNLCLEDRIIMVLNFIVMHSKVVKTSTRCAVDVALRGGSEMVVKNNDVIVYGVSVY